MLKDQSIIIIGGGLSGLTLAYLIAKKGVTATVLEGTSRLGGRIQTIQGTLSTPMELGATWFSDIHPNLIALLSELNIEKYPQYSIGKSLFQTKSFEPAQEFHVPEAQAPSYRIAGGTQSLIDALAKKLDTDNIKLNQKVISIKEVDQALQIETKSKEIFMADKVVLCLPPQLAHAQINISPPLPIDVNELLPTVQTWMAGSIKFVLEYDQPFWRQRGYSGMLYSHSGIVSEMYDHTNIEEDKYGFTGFLNGGAASYTQEVRKEFVLRQLAELLGEKAAQPISYQDKIWNDESIVSGHQIILRPHQNNGHSVLQKSYLNKRLYFSGTESSEDFSGYMEGAIIAAIRVFDRLVKESS